MARQARRDAAPRAQAPSVDAYIAAAAPAAQPLLRQLRKLVREVAPGAEERISYGIPAYRLGGRLTYFAAHTHHIGMYPAGADDARAAGLSANLAEKATLRFPLDAPLPVDGIRRFLELRVKAAQSKQ